MVAAMVGLGPAGAPPVGKLYGSFNLFGLMTYVPALTWTALLLAVVLLFPSNTQEILDQYSVALPTLPSPAMRSWARLRWQPTIAWTVACALLVGVALVFSGGPSPFLYYKF